MRRLQIFPTCIWLIFMVNVGKYTSPIDGTRKYHVVIEHDGKTLNCQTYVFGDRMHVKKPLVFSKACSIAEVYSLLQHVIGLMFPLPVR